MPNKFGTTNNYNPNQFQPQFFMFSNELRNNSVDVSRNDEEFISPSPMEDYRFPPHLTQVGLDSIDQNKSV